MTATKLQLIIEALNKTDPAFNDLKRHLKDSQGDTDKLNAKSKDLSGSIKSLAVSIIGLGTAMATLRAGTTYLAKIETATLGIAAAFMTGGKYIDATSGKALAAQEALTAAQHESQQLIKELQYANLQTIATLDQLIVAYQQTLPVALARGFDKTQIKEFTVAMVQAAGAIGLPMDQLGEETRSLLTGAINPRTSRIATVLGLRNEDIARYKDNANGLFDFLMQKLDAYKIAGVAAQNTWEGLWSNAKDIALQYLGQGLEPLFEAVKYELQSITAEVVTLDETTKTIKWNPDFISGVKGLKDGVTAAIAELYRMGMLLDKMGGSFTRMMHGISFSELTGYEGFAAKNDEYRERYLKSEKALQDLAMRGEGWKPVTPDIQKQMMEAARAGKKIFEQIQVNVEGAAGNQLLRYYREIDKKQAQWAGKKPPPDVDEKLVENWENLKRSLEADIAKAGLDEFESRLVDINKKVEELLAKKEVKGTPGAAALVKAWGETQTNEASTAAARKDFDEYLKLAKEITAHRESFVKKRQAAREAEINAQIAAIDLTETEGAYHRNTLDERIRLLQELVQIQQEHLAGLDKEKDPASWYAQLAAVNATKQKVAELRGEMRPVFSELKKYAEESTDIWKNVGNAVTNTFKGMEDALTEFCMTGKLSFSNLANAIIRDLIRIQIQQSITGPMAKGLGGFITKLFAPAGGEFGGLGAAADIYHTGGMGSEPTSYRIMPNPDLLPRYHKGLGPGERLSVTTNDEMILTPGQQRRVAELMQNSNASPATLKIEIINESGSKMQVSDSRMSFNFQEMVVKVWLDAANRNAYGLRTALGG
jgi:hypothetical protein